VDSKRGRVSVTEGDTTRHFGMGQHIRCSLFEEAIPVDAIFN